MMRTTIQATESTQLVLRRGHQEIQMGVGDYLIGRDAECSVRLEDPLISRKHAKLTVEPGAATIADLSSANGVFVNGRRVVAETRLSPGDHILIGKEEIEVASVVERQPSAPERDLVRDTLRMEPHVQEAPADAGVDATSRVDTFALIARVVDRVLAEGRGGDAERMLSPQLDVVLRETIRRGAAPTETAVRATEYAIKLAQATRNGKWVDYVIQLHTASLRPLPSGMATALIAATKSCDAFDRAALRSYVSRLLSTAERLGPAERSDLEVLGGLASASTTH